MTDKAKEAWGTVYHDLSADRSGLAGALLGRAEAQVMRLSALYAVLGGHANIDVEHLKAALALWDYAESSNRLIFGDGTGDKIADAILGALRLYGELDDTGINGLFSRNILGARLDQAKALLQRNGLAFPHMDGTPGRARLVWRPCTKKTN
jgi:hypothetical protein